MRTRCVDAARRRLDDIDGERLREAALHLRHPRTDAVAREPAADEDDEPVEARDAVAAVGERVDLKLDFVVHLHRGGHAPQGTSGDVAAAGSHHAGGAEQNDPAAADRERRAVGEQVVAPRPVGAVERVEG